MGLISGFSSLLGKDSSYSVEYKKFKKAIQRNPADIGLKSEFIKFCLLNRFTNQEAAEDHVSEALRLFESFPDTDHFDLQCHYLVGKYYQEEKDYRKAYQVYLNALKRFNQRVAKDPALKAENVELVYSVALNLMALQSDPVAPEVEQSFKIIRKSFPLHLKRIEFENEMAKPAPNAARIKQLTEEIRRLKAEEEKGSSPAPAEKTHAAAPAEKASAVLPVEKATPASSDQKAPETTEPSKAVEAAPGVKLKEPKGFFSKLFTELSPESLGLTASQSDPQNPKILRDKADSADSLKLSPPSEAGAGSTFLVHHNNHWEGPYTPAQLQSLGFLKPAAWVCRAGSQQVIQAYEVPDLQAFLQGSKKA